MKLIIINNGGIVMSDLFTAVKSGLENSEKKRIVFPEATDERILNAASRLADENLLIPVLIGNEADITKFATELDISIAGCEIVDPSNYPKFDEMVSLFVERRKGKATEEAAREILLEGNYFGTMLVYLNKADGLVSGAIHSTSDTVRPALQIIKTKADVKSEAKRS